MTISDIASNPLLAGPDATGPMLGYVEPAAADEVLALRMYDFLIKPIREQDLIDGQLFLERYIQGPQEVWETIQTDIFRLLDLWDITRIQDTLLKYLKNIVGWTPELERPITDRLAYDDLRRLISVSVVLWKIRGTEEAYTRCILALVLTRMRVWNWFDLRWILDETVIGEDHQGRDPYILASVEEQKSDIRIVDAGGDTLDRTLLLNMLKLFRPSGERLNVYWIDFLDLFLVDGDDSQWSGWPDPLPVADRMLSLTDDSGLELAVVGVDGSLLWEDYVVYLRVRGAPSTPLSSELFGVYVYWQDSDNNYLMFFDVVSNSFILGKVLVGAFSPLTTYYFAADTEVLKADVFYGLRVHVETVPSGTRIRVYIDGLERIDYTDTSSPFTRGSIGIIHTADATMELSEAELFQLPLDSNFIDINEAP